jgi:hypothetical protein
VQEIFVFDASEKLVSKIEASGRQASHMRSFSAENAEELEDLVSVCYNGNVNRIHPEWKACD